jgi:hypothetical protein
VFAVINGGRVDSFRLQPQYPGVYLWFSPNKMDLQGMRQALRGPRNTNFVFEEAPIPRTMTMLLVVFVVRHRHQKQ